MVLTHRCTRRATMAEIGLVSVVEACTVGIICVFSIIGNASLFVIVYRTPTLHTVANYYILSLATADLLVTMVSGPVMVATISLGDWMFGEITCTLFGYFTIVTFISSVANLAMIALNRYFYIVHWKSYRSHFSKLWSAVYGVMVWLFALVLAFPPLVGWGRFAYIPDQAICFVDWSANVYYMYFTVSICFFGPLITMTVCYYKILSFTKSLKQRLAATPAKTEAVDAETNLPRSNPRGLRRISPQEAKITSTLQIVVLCFVLSWLGFALTIFLNVYLPNRLPAAINKWCLILGFFNSMYNPLIYGIRNPTFKAGFKDLFLGCLPCYKRRIADACMIHEAGSSQCRGVVAGRSHITSAHTMQSDIRVMSPDEGVITS